MPMREKQFTFFRNPDTNGDTEAQKNKNACVHGGEKRVFFRNPDTNGALHKASSKISRAHGGLLRARVISVVLDSQLFWRILNAKT